MAQEAQMKGEVIRLPADYQSTGGSVLPDDGYDVPDEPDVDAIDELPEATIESWLMDVQPPEEWVALKTRRMKVLIRGLSEEERKQINAAAPRKPNRQTKRTEPDQEWINTELVRRCLLQPKVPRQDMLMKAMAGDLAHIAGEIGRISGFDLSDALD